MVADGPGVLNRASTSLGEADRLMTICNACRYCEGLCAVFPAMERRRSFTDGDLDYLANLCHNCGACLYDCQYAPPHPFAVAVPSTLAELRVDTWRRYGWPRWGGGLLADRPVAVAAGATAAAIVVFVIGVLAVRGDEAFTAQRGEGAFYRVVPHDVIVAVFSIALLAAIGALVVALRRFWVGIGGGPVRFQHLAGAGRSASTLEYLDGGGVGCMNVDEHPTDSRRLYHHATYYGFAACLASTTLAAILETGFDQQAPFPLFHPVVVLGTIGGIGLVVGPIGLLVAKFRRDPDLSDPSARPMELTFLALLLAVSVTGFAVLVARTTAAMPILLAVHLGVVLGFFVTLPYGKFVHGGYRYLALVKDRQERSAAAVPDIV